MNYQLLITRRAQKQMAKLGKELQERVDKAILTLLSDPRPPNSLKLSTRKAWRLKIGEIRVVYEIYDKKRTIVILLVDFRKNIYKHLKP